MGGSLVLASLDVGRALADTGRATFRAHGTCMYPTVKPGDVLHVASRTIEQIGIGDIAVCRRAGVLLGHRAIGKGVRDGRPYIVTRPDRAGDVDDGPTFAEDVLGVVTDIERRGRRRSPEPRRPAAAARLYLRVRLKLLGSRLAARDRLMRGLGFAQRRAAWRWMGTRWLRVTGRSPSFVVWVPLRAGQTHDLHTAVSADEFDVLAPTWQGRPPEAWTLVLRLGEDPEPAARATFVPHLPLQPAAGWSAVDVVVRSRYRGLDLERRLMEEAAAILASSGVPLAGDGTNNARERQVRRDGYE